MLIALVLAPGPFAQAGSVEHSESPAAPDQADNKEKRAFKIDDDIPPVAFNDAMEALFSGDDRHDVAVKFRGVHQTLVHALTRPNGKMPNGIAPGGFDVLELANLLDAMAKEDEAWQEPQDVDALPIEQQIAYHIYHLRDTVGRPFSVPGKVKILSGFGFVPGSNAAAKALRDIAKPAIPALIDLLDDDRPTRAISTGLNGAHVLRYREAAVEILSAIAGKRFMPHVNRGVYFSNAPQEVQDKVVREITQWWQDNREKTEAQWLREALMEDGVGRNVAGDDRAQRLIALQGLASLDLFRHRIKAEPVNGNAVRHFWLAATSEGPAEPAILDELRVIEKSPHPGPRVQAYRILLQHGTPKDQGRIVPKLVEEIDAIAKLDDWNWREVGFDFNPDELISLLCQDAQPKGFKQACKLLEHNDPRIMGTAINDLLRRYNAEAGPALDEPSFDLLAAALVDAIDERPDEEGEPLHISYRVAGAQWLFRKFDMYHQDRNHRRIEPPKGWPHLKEDEKLPFVRDVVAWCREHADLKRRGELPADARPHDEGVTIIGRVLDRPGGEGAEGVTVTLLASSDQSRRFTVTDSDGRYAFPAVPAIGMAHQIRVGKHGPGVLTYSTYLHVQVPEKRLGLKEMQAERDLYANHPYILRGTVTDAQTGKGIPNAQIQVEMSDRNPGTLATDALGRYQIHTVTPEVTVKCNGDFQRYYAPPIKPEEGEDPAEANLRRRTVALKSGETVDGIDFQLYPAPAYSLRFVMPDGSAASGMEVYVLQMYTRLEPLLEEGFRGGFASMGHHDALTTDPDGRIAGHLRSAYGRQQRAAIELSIIARTQDLKHGVTRKIKLTTEDPPPDGLEIKLEPCATAELRVTDPDGQGVGQADVHVSAMYKHHAFGYPHALPETVALGDGRFRFEGMIAGWTYRLNAKAQGLKTGEQITVEVKAGKHEDAGTLLMDWWDRRAVPGLLLRLEHPDPHEREQACRQLAELKPEAAAAVPALSVILKADPSNTVRYQAAAALGEIGDAAAAAVPQLIDALENDKHGVPREAAIALGKLAGHEAVEPLIQALKHEDMGTRHAVIDAMVRIDKNGALAPLADILRDAEVHGRTKIYAVKKLEHIGSTNALPVLRETLETKNRTLKDAAEQAIRAIEFLNKPQIGFLDVPFGQVY